MSLIKHISAVRMVSSETNLRILNMCTFLSLLTPVNVAD